MLIREPQVLQPVSLPFSPLEAARKLQKNDGFVFLDSSLSGPGATSILGARPEEILVGNLADPTSLREKLANFAAGGGSGAAIGWIGYDGNFVFGIYRHLLIYSHDTDFWQGMGTLADFFHPETASEHSSVDFELRMARETFCEMVDKAREYIAAGDIYQVCLSHPFVCSRWGADSWAFYEKFREVSPAPHAAFLRLNGYEILSASPETFLRIDDRVIATRPIKGTSARYEDAARDAASAKELLASKKEAAELVMITDLERNDLGRVCEYGSIKVKEMLALESFQQVFHLVSTVEGRLREECSHLDALIACFPGGSISGAPKIRACEVIAELEPFPRGIYTGAIGYFGFDGKSQFNIAIRTVVVHGEEASFHVGAGIVADSQPEREWVETLEKASGILKAAQGG
ncbi:MAG: chorismate-binding protein [Chthoniobacterales bacterium]